jgi:hypothetical protein
MHTLTGPGLLVCHDCGCRPWGDWVEPHEDYYVHNELWRAACPDDDGFILCIGCLEARLGRTLRRPDFGSPPNDSLGPPSDRFMDRWNSVQGAAP